jgi:periplasmic divalent cation tolerance protein
VTSVGGVRPFGLLAGASLIGGEQRSVPDDAIEVTVTAPDADWLAGLCRALVEARLCASAHVLAPVRSIYRWEDVVREAGEARAFLRSRRAHLDAIVAFVTARHPYHTPNVTAVPIVGGNPAYLDWIARETGGADG